MAIVQKRNMSCSSNVTAIAAATNWKTWLDTFSAPFVVTEVTGNNNNATFTATFDDKFRLEFNYYNADLWSLTSYFRSYKVGDTPPNFSPSMGRDYAAILVLTSTSIFLTVDTWNARHYAIAYEILGAQSFYGSLFYDRDGSGGIPRQIQEIPLTKYGEASPVYAHTSALNYAVVPGYIDFSNTDLLSDGTNSVNDTNYIGCSTVNSNYIYTFNGNNFYALGPHTLVLANNSLEE